MNRAYRDFRKMGLTARFALDAARNENWFYAQDDLRFQWVPDDDPDLSWMSERERKTVNEVVGCVVERQCPTCHHWKPLPISLWGIVDPDNAYIRDVEADLAGETREWLDEEGL